MDGQKKTIEYFKNNYAFSWKWLMDHLAFLNKESPLALDIALQLSCCGSRATEQYSLLRNQIDLDTDPDNVWIRNQMVEKHRTAEVLKDITGRPILWDGKKQISYMPKEVTRTYPLMKGEPTTKEFIKLIKVKDIDNEYDKDKGEPNYRVCPYDRKAQYYRLSLVGAREKGLVHLKEWNKPQYRSGLWSHLYRSVKATSLIYTYPDYRNNISYLMKYFGWASDEMPLRYIGITPKMLSLNAEQQKGIKYV